MNGDPLPLVDIDEFADLALAHDVTAVPTVVGVKNGKCPRECAIYRMLDAGLWIRINLSCCIRIQETKNYPQK